MPLTWPARYESLLMAYEMPGQLAGAMSMMLLRQISGGTVVVADIAMTCPSALKIDGERDALHFCHRCAREIARNPRSRIT